MRWHLADACGATTTQETPSSRVVAQHMPNHMPQPQSPPHALGPAPCSMRATNHLWAEPQRKPGPGPRQGPACAQALAVTPCLPLDVPLGRTSPRRARGCVRDCCPSSVQAAARSAAVGSLPKPLLFTRLQSESHQMQDNKPYHWMSTQPQ